MKRRDLWTLLLLAGLPVAALPNDTANVVHVLNRLGFGPRPGDVERLQQVGLERYIQDQLQPTAIPQSAALTREIASLDLIPLAPNQLIRQYDQLPKDATEEQRKAAREKSDMVLEQARQARFAQALQSPRQLQEVMVDFWFNHFNVFSDKGQVRWWVGSYEDQAIRPYALGFFRELLGATAHHPAMLFYLDNWQSSLPKVGRRGAVQGGLNENYARELMELHTLGVQGGYTQEDVVTLAKILTGWTIAKPADGDSFYFDVRRHDASDKTFLGYPITGGGQEEGEKALDILASHPATAQHIAYKLAQYFVTDEPPTNLVNQLAIRFSNSGGHIRDVLNTLFHSKEFWDVRYRGTKFKSPYRYVLSALRATDTSVTNYSQLRDLLKQMGMPLFSCLTPDGYKNTQSAWLNSDALTRRIAYATSLSAVDAQQLLKTLGGQLSPKTMQVLQSLTAPMQVSKMTSPMTTPASVVILGSPDFMRY
jgi:uncharacterized protein (DUF1800 family)